jgi:hypothetical protein
MDLDRLRRRRLRQVVGGHGLKRKFLVCLRELARRHTIFDNCAVWIAGVDRAAPIVVDLYDVVAQKASYFEGVVMSGWRPLIKGFFAALRLIVGAVMSSAC